MTNICRNQTHSICPRYFVALLLMVTLAACSRQIDTEEADVRTIDSTISLFSVSLAKADTAALKEICAPEFVLFDEAEPHELAGLFRSITDTQSSSSMKRQPVGVEIATRPDGAWSCYNVAGEFQTAGQSTPLDIIESAYLERDGGKWKIVQVCTIHGNTK